MWIFAKKIINHIPLSVMVRFVMISVKLFPTILIIIDFLAAFIYLVNFDYKHFLYWVAAGILTLMVTI